MSYAHGMDNTTCYYGNSRYPVLEDWAVCSSDNDTSVARTCCIAGHTCLQDSICYNAHPSPKGSGYYIGACTDGKFSEPGCSKQCTGTSETSNIVYNASLEAWGCCQSTGSDFDCTVPSRNETFSAPAPNALTTLEAISKTISSSVIASSTLVNTSLDIPSATPAQITARLSSTTSTVEATTTDAPLQTSNSCANGACSARPNPGTLAGIGVAAAVVGIGAIGTIVFLLRRASAKRSMLKLGGNTNDRDSDAHIVRSPSLHTRDEDISEMDGARKIELEGPGFVEMEERNRVEIGQ